MAAMLWRKEMYRTTGERDAKICFAGGMAGRQLNRFRNLAEEVNAGTT